MAGALPPLLGDCKKRDPPVSRGHWSLLPLPPLLKAALGPSSLAASPSARGAPVHPWPRRPR